MNKWVGMGRLTRDPNVRYSQGENATCITRYTIAVDRRYKRDGEQTADFISCIAFGRAGEFAEKYFHKGIKIVVEGRIQTGSYTNKDGQKVYTTDVVVENQEFAESKAASDQYQQDEGFEDPQESAENQPNQYKEGPQTESGYKQQGITDEDGFMKVDDSAADYLPFV